MPLTPHQVEQFKTEGYTIAERFFTPREVAAMQAEVERFQREGLLRNVATDGDGQTHSSTRANLQLCPMYHRSPLWRALPYEPRVIEAVTALIGEPIRLHLDQIFLKPPRVGMGTHWHQDNAYFRIADPRMGTALWVAIHDATAANGTLRVIPGSHREVYEHTRDPFSDHHIRCFPPSERAVACELEAGGVAFFCYGTAHCTGDNTTERERAGAAFHFLRADQVPEREREQQAYRPWLTGPRASGGLHEPGEKVAGTWQQHVEQALAG